MRTVSLLAIGVTVSLLHVSTVAGSQLPVQRIDGEPTCGGCTIERYPVATIHDRDYPPGALAGGAFAHPASAGRFFVVAGAGFNELFLTDESGAIVRQIGAVGQGPGEYMFPESVVETPSAVAVVDVRQGRLTILDKETLEYVRDHRMPRRGAGVWPVMFEDGSYVVSESTSGATLHLISPDGELVRSFGSAHGGKRPTWLSLSGDSAFWAGYLASYRLELWSRQGELLQVLERAPGWLVFDGDEVGPGDRYMTVGQSYEDEEGLLWVHIWVRTRSDQPGRFIVGDPSASASIVEVIDPRRGEVVASNQFSGIRQAAAGQGQGAFYQMASEETPAGTIVLRIWGNRLRRGSSPIPPQAIQGGTW